MGIDNGGKGIEIDIIKENFLVFEVVWDLFYRLLIVFKKDNYKMVNIWMYFEC